MSTQKFLHLCRQTLLVILAESFLLIPTLSAYVVNADLANAASAPEQLEQTCDPSIAKTSGPVTSEGPDSDPSDAPVILPFISREELDSNPIMNKQERLELLQQLQAVYDSEYDAYFFCTYLDTDNVFSLATVQPHTNSYLDTVDDPYARIDFKNDEDRYAVTGETCHRWDDETCTDYDDTIWPDGAREKPRADVRVLHTLVYLVTPSVIVGPDGRRNGGAGRDYIKVGRILQEKESNPEFDSGNAEDQAQDDPSAIKENENKQSVHYYGLPDSDNPDQVAQALDITEIDRLRITTRITQKSRLGDDQVSYYYKNFPIKVDWQTNGGIKKSPPPAPSDVYTGALTAANSGILNLLSETSLDTSGLSTADFNLNSFADIARVVGGTALSEQLGGFAKSIGGLDPVAALDQFGRGYLARQLGLPENAFAGAESGNEAIMTVGRSVIEQSLGLPSGSLSTPHLSSEELLQKIGQRYLEDQILQVSQDTLGTQLSGDPMTLLARVGAGRIEKRFNLPAGSLLGNDFDALIKKYPRLTSIFSKDQQTARTVDEDLNLVGINIKDGANRFGIKVGEFDNATFNFLNGKIGFERYKQLVGSRTLEQGIGSFAKGTSNFSSLGQKTVCPSHSLEKDESPGACCPDSTSFGSEPANTNCQTESSLTADSNFITFFFANVFGQDVRSGASVGDLMNTKYGKLFVNTGIFAHDGVDGTTGARDFISAIAKAQRDGTYKINGNNPDNLIPKQNEITDIWRPVLKRALLNIDNQERQAKALQNNPGTDTPSRVKDVTDPKTFHESLEKARKVIDRGLSLVNQEADALTQILDMRGQSGMSAALGIPATLYQSVKGKITTNKIADQDPVTALIGGTINGSILNQIGRIQLARQVTPDLTGQRILAGEIVTSKDPKADYDLFDRSGISETNIRNKGLVSGDFERLFEKNLASEVFRRVGTTELLRTAWNRSELQPNTDTLDPNSSSTSVDTDVQTTKQDISFYTGRFDELSKQGGLIEQLLSAAGSVDSLAGARQDLQQLNQAALKVKPASVTAVQQRGREYEALVKRFSDCTDGSCSDVRLKAENAASKLREIAAGHSLALDQAAAASSGDQSGQSSEECYSRQKVRAAVTNGKALTDFSKDLAICQLAESLNFPGDSLKNWYANADTKGLSLDSLAEEVGKVAVPGKKAVDATTAKKRGMTVLNTRIAKSLSGGALGFGNLTDRYTFDANDVLSVLQGNADAVQMKLGGITLDRSLHWQPGTTAQLARPLCPQSDGTSKVCAPNEAESARMLQMAKVGFAQLGQKLKLPTSFELTGQGKLFANFGNSFASEAMVIDKNTFWGTANDVRSRQFTPKSLVFGIGIYDTPYIEKLRDLRGDILHDGRQAGTAIDPMAQAIANHIENPNEKATADQTIPAAYNAVLDDLGHAGSTFWSSDHAKGGQTLAQEYGKQYMKSLADLTAYVNATYKNGSADKYLAIIASYSIEGKQADSQADYWQKTYGRQFKYTLDSLQTRTSSLDTIFHASKGTVVQFLTGKVTADSINNQIAQVELVTGSKPNAKQNTGKLSDNYLTKNLKDTGYIKNVVNVFTDLTKGAGSCKDGITVEQLFNGAKCLGGPLASGIGNMDLAKLFSTDTNFQQAKTFLFDHLLARTFSDSMESLADFQPGTFRNLVANPNQGMEILLGQGFYKMSDQLFKFKASGDLSKFTDLTKTFMGTFSDGFYNVLKNNYSFNLNLDSIDRTIGDLQTTLINRLGDGYLHLANKVIGDTVSISDLTQIANGDLGTLAFIGLDRYVGGLDKDLRKKVGDDPMQAFFQIAYSEVRDSLGMGIFSEVEQNLAKADFGAQYIRTKLAGVPLLGDVLNLQKNNIDGFDCPTVGGKSLCDGSLSDGDLVNSYLNDPAFANDAYDIVAAGERGLERYATDFFKGAQQQMQYAVYDLLAFKIDQHIPPGFMETMITGNDAERAAAIGEFALSQLKIPGADLLSLLGQKNVDSLLSFAQNGFQGSVNFDMTTALNSLDGWLTSNSSKLLGIDLPPGIIQGFYSWGASGFSSDAFTGDEDTGETSLSGFNGSFSALGTNLQNWGMQKVFGWADKALGFDAGSVYNLYKNVQAFQEAYQSYQTLTQMSDFDVSMYEDIFGEGSYSDTLNSSQSNLAASQAALITLAINMVFSKQIGQLESALGLTPGTGSIAVGILVTFLMTGAVNPMSIALFVGLNLFGTYETVVEIRASADGYYPWLEGPDGKVNPCTSPNESPQFSYGDTGVIDKAKLTEENARSNEEEPPTDGTDTASTQDVQEFKMPLRVPCYDPYEYPSPDVRVGEFDAKNPASYRQGIKRAAQNKVNGLIADLLVMPEEWATVIHGDPRSLFIEQIYTVHDEGTSTVPWRVGLDHLISRNAPWNSPPGLGYGPIDKRLDIKNADSGHPSGKPKAGYRAGVFADPDFWNHVHVSW